MQKQGIKCDPFTNPKDRRVFNENLAYRIVYALQDNIRIMPTTMVASMLLMHRKGVNQKELLQTVAWLGSTLRKRGILIQSLGLPSQQTVDTGLEHLKDYIE